MSCSSNPRYDYQTAQNSDNGTRAREFYCWFMMEHQNRYRSSPHCSAHLFGFWCRRNLPPHAKSLAGRPQTETCCLFNEKNIFFSPVSSNLSADIINKINNFSVTVITVYVCWLVVEVTEEERETEIKVRQTKLEKRAFYFSQSDKRVAWRKFV